MAGMTDSKAETDSCRTQVTGIQLTQQTGQNQIPARVIPSRRSAVPGLIFSPTCLRPADSGLPLRGNRNDRSGAGMCCGQADCRKMQPCCVKWIIRKSSSSVAVLLSSLQKKPHTSACSSSSRSDMTRKPPRQKFSSRKSIPMERIRFSGVSESPAASRARYLGTKGSPSFSY